MSKFTFFTSAHYSRSPLFYGGEILIFRPVPRLFAGSFFYLGKILPAAAFYILCKFSFFYVPRPFLDRFAGSFFYICPLIPQGLFYMVWKFAFLWFALLVYQLHGEQVRGLFPCILEALAGVQGASPCIVECCCCGDTHSMLANCEIDRRNNNIMPFIIMPLQAFKRRFLTFSGRVYKLHSPQVSPRLSFILEALGA